MADEYIAASPTTTLIVIEDSVIGNAQSFAHRVIRNKTPIFVLGSVEAKGISRGQRMVAGSMDGVVLSGNFLFEVLKQSAKYLGIIDSDAKQTALNAGLSLEDYIRKASQLHNIIFGEYRPGVDQKSFMTNTWLGYVFKEGSQQYNNIVNAIDQYLKAANTPGAQDQFLNAINVMSTELHNLIKQEVPGGLSGQIDNNYLRYMPIIYLDQIPPIDVTLISLIEKTERKDGKWVRKAEYESVTLYGVEFVSDDIAISVGNEQLAETVNFIQRGAISRKGDIVNKQPDDTQTVNNVQQAQ